MRVSGSRRPSARARKAPPADDGSLTTAERRRLLYDHLRRLQDIARAGGWALAFEGLDAAAAQLDPPGPGVSVGPASCVVPKLKGKSPRKARSALRAAHCALGKVRKPKAKKGHKLGPLVVKSFSPAAGTTLPAGGKVSLMLVKKKYGRAHRRRHG